MLTRYQDLPIGVTLIDAKFANLLVRHDGDKMIFLNMHNGKTFEFIPEGDDTVHDYQVHYPCRGAP